MTRADVRVVQGCVEINFAAGSRGLEPGAYLRARPSAASAVVWCAAFDATAGGQPAAAGGCGSGPGGVMEIVRLAKSC